MQEVSAIKETQSIKFWALIFVTGPLRQIIVYINNPHTIEDMARWFEFRWNFCYTPKIDGVVKSPN